MMEHFPIEVSPFASQVGLEGNRETEAPCGTTLGVRPFNEGGASKGGKGGGKVGHGGCMLRYTNAVEVRIRSQRREDGGKKWLYRTERGSWVLQVST